MRSCSFRNIWEEITSVSWLSFELLFLDSKLSFLQTIASADRRSDIGYDYLPWSGETREEVEAERATGDVEEEVSRRKSKNKPTATTKGKGKKKAAGGGSTVAKKRGRREESGDEGAYKPEKKKRKSEVSRREVEQEGNPSKRKADDQEEGEKELGRGKRKKFQSAK
jgi:hypothetical protein